MQHLQDYIPLCASVKTFLTHLLKNMPKIGLDRTNQITRKQETIDKLNAGIYWQTQHNWLITKFISHTYIMRASSISTNFYQFLAFLWIAHDLIFLANCATVRSFPRYDYGKPWFYIFTNIRLVIGFLPWRVKTNELLGQKST